MNLSQVRLILTESETRGSQDPRIKDVKYDSRGVVPGDLFVCIPGYRHDGHQFAPEAVSRGAVALVVEKFLELNLPQVRVKDSRKALLALSKHFAGDPAQKLVLLGVTGTNGKTTVCYLTRHILTSSGWKVGQLGTVTNVVGGREIPVVRTTPESRDLYGLLRDMARAGDQAAVMEVSSHALALDRVDPRDVRVAAFTNLSQDHLDFHQDMEEYFNTKALLFQVAGHGDEPRGVVNTDDPWGRRLIGSSSRKLLTFGIRGQPDLRAVNLEVDQRGSRFDLLLKGESCSVQLPLGGVFNVSNALAAAAMALSLGLDLGDIAGSLSDAPPVPGRFELVDRGQGFAVIVDYAHTPAGLENVLRAARQITEGRVIAVFGCGGDRDKRKRPVMGRISAQLADLTVITNDNPRSEEPSSILEQILKGHQAAQREGAQGQAVVEPDRARGIEMAIGWARAGDTVIIAGKGHETYQVFADRTEDFDDRQVAAEMLARRG